MLQADMQLLHSYVVRTQNTERAQPNCHTFFRTTDQNTLPYTCTCTPDQFELKGNYLITLELRSHKQIILIIDLGPRHRSTNRIPFSTLGSLYNDLYFVHLNS